LMYIVSICLLSLAVGGILSLVGGILTLTLLIVASLSALVAVGCCEHVSFLQTAATCIVAVVSLNLGWFGALLLAATHSPLMSRREEITFGKMLHGSRAGKSAFRK
jgi:hypothetical protein